jgi:PAS domain S-box-containing protein
MNNRKVSDPSNQSPAGATTEICEELNRARHALWDEIERHRKTTHALHELEETHYRILESLNCGLMITEKEGRILSVNSRLEKLSGYTAEELHNRGFLSLIPNQVNRQKLLRIYSSFARVKDWKIPLKRKDGSTCIVSLNVDSTEIAGQEIQVTSIQDITFYKLLDENDLNDNKMDEFVALAGSIAHDLNNLLNVVTGYGEMAIEDPNIKSSVREDIKQIVESGKQAARLTSQLLALTGKS